MRPDAIETNNRLDSSERMPIHDLPSHSIQCATCLLVVAKECLKAAGYYCRECGDMICVRCGCTNNVACDEGCEWIEPGVCSTHRDSESGDEN